jgi:hypothetical protein
MAALTMSLSLGQLGIACSILSFNLLSNHQRQKVGHVCNFVSDLSAANPWKKLYT